MKDDKQKQAKELKKLFDAMPDGMKKMVEDGLKQKYIEKADEQKQKLEADVPQIMKKISKMVNAPFVLIVELTRHSAVMSATKDAEHTKRLIEESLEEVSNNWDELKSKKIPK